MERVTLEVGSQTSQHLMEKPHSAASLKAINTATQTAKTNRRGELLFIQQVVRVCKSKGGSSARIKLEGIEVQISFPRSTLESGEARGFTSRSQSARPADMDSPPNRSGRAPRTPHRSEHDVHRVAVHREKREHRELSRTSHGQFAQAPAAAELPLPTPKPLDEKKMLNEASVKQIVEVTGLEFSLCERALAVADGDTTKATSSLLDEMQQQVEMERQQQTARQAEAHAVLVAQKHAAHADHQAAARKAQKAAAQLQADAQKAQEADELQLLAEAQKVQRTLAANTANKAKQAAANAKQLAVKAADKLANKEMEAARVATAEAKMVEAKIAIAPPAPTPTQTRSTGSANTAVTPNGQQHIHSRAPLAKPYSRSTLSGPARPRTTPIPIAEASASPAPPPKQPKPAILPKEPKPVAPDPGSSTD
jgi:hypothetical protein